MILCVDIGNTASKIALVAGARVTRRAVVPALTSERELARACARVLRGTGSLDAAAVSSVRPRATDAVVRMIVRATFCTGRFMCWCSMGAEKSFSKSGR